MRVGLNLMFLGDHGGGVGRLAVELVGALAERADVEVVCFVCADAPKEVFQVAGADRVRFVRVPVRRPGSRLHLLAHFGLVPLLALMRRCEVLHSPGNTGPVRVPGLPCAVSLYDVIWRHVGDDWADAAAQAAMERVTVPTARHADRLLTASEHSADDIVAELGIPRERIDVVPAGVRVDPDLPATPEHELRGRLGVGEAAVLLCVAQKRPYKNQDVLVRALEALPRDVVLVLPGAPTPYEHRLRELALELGVAERVRFMGWVSEEDLEGLYRMASAVVLPSRLEGFGIPVLEAMARGVPVVCSRTTALGEVAGDAALLVDPEDAAGVAAAVARILDDAELRERLRAAGRRRAASFSWARVAEETLSAYRRAVAARRA